VARIGPVGEPERNSMVAPGSKSEAARTVTFVDLRRSRAGKEMMRPGSMRLTEVSFDASRCAARVTPFPSVALSASIR